MAYFRINKETCPGLVNLGSSPDILINLFHLKCIGCRNNDPNWGHRYCISNADFGDIYFDTEMNRNTAFEKICECAKSSESNKIVEYFPS